MNTITGNTAKKHRMTKKEALEICIKMWDWLADNPTTLSSGVEKREAIAVLNLPDLGITNCAACHYAEQNLYKKRGSFCAPCPVWNCNGRDLVCLDLDSDYKKWSECSTLSDKEKYARNVANLAKKRLEQLNRKQLADKKRRAAKKVTNNG